MIASHCIWLIFAPYYKCWVVQTFKISNDWFDILTSYYEHYLLLAPICIYVWLSKKISKCWLITRWCWLWWKGMAVDSMPALNVCRKSILRKRNITDNVLRWNSSVDNLSKILNYTCTVWSRCGTWGSYHPHVFVLACKHFLQFKVQRKVGAALFPPLLFPDTWELLYKILKNDLGISIYLSQHFPLVCLKKCFHYTT